MYKRQVLALPFFGVISEIFPVMSRRPIFGYKTLIFATVAIAGLSVAVWAHHLSLIHISEPTRPY